MSNEDKIKELRRKIGNTDTWKRYMKIKKIWELINDEYLSLKYEVRHSEDWLKIKEINQKIGG